MNRIPTLMKKLLLICCIYLVLFLLIFYSKELSAGIRGGIETALGLVVPSLFLFLIASNLLTRSRAGVLAARPFRFLARLFRIPPDQILLVVLSLAGGYPVGAKLLADEVWAGRLSPGEASRMLCFCVNCGPAFLISGVGAAVFGSLKAGVYLYLSQVIACLFTGWLSARSAPRASGRVAPALRRYPPLPELIVSGVTDAARALFTICAFVVAFAAFLPLLSLPLEEFGPLPAALFRGFLEVTSGCEGLASAGLPQPLLLAAGFTSFGGICVLLQISALLKGTGIKMGRFLAFRIPYILVSLLTMWGALLLDPGVSEVFSYNQSASRRIFTVSPLASAFLLLLAMMLLFFPRKAVKIDGKKN